MTNIFYPVRAVNKSNAFTRVAIACILSFLSVTWVSAQSNGKTNEDRTFSINLKAPDQHDALVKLGRETGFNFSYNTELLSEKPVSVKVKNKPLSFILSEILGDNYHTYEAIGNQIVLIPRTENKAPEENRVSGTLYDPERNEPVQFANIGIMNSNYGTISNTEGKFSLLIDSANSHDTLVISALGYIQHQIPVQKIRHENQIIFLRNQYIPIQEVVIRQLDPSKLVSRSIDRIDENHFTGSINLQSFYREYLMKDNTLRSLYEAIVTIYKPGFGSLTNDQVKVEKAVNLIDSTKRDTVTVKLKGGLSNISALDLAKTKPYFYNKPTLGAYKFNIENIVHAQNNDVYVIRFRPVDKPGIPPFKGRLYIEVNTLALIKAEVTLESKNHWDDVGVQVFRKAPGLKPTLRSLSFVVQYSKLGDKYYLKYFRSDISLRIKKKKGLFYSNYNMISELLSTRIDTTANKSLSYRERINPETIFSDEIKNYPADFWMHYNTLPPETEMLRDYFTE